MSAIDRPDTYLYKIDPIERLLVSGVSEDNVQILAGLAFPNIIRIEFDLAGNLMGAIKTCIADQKHDTSWSDFVENEYLPVIDAFLKDNGFQRQPISIKKFAIPEEEICIEDLPRTFRDILANPNCYDDSDVVDARNIASIWSQTGKFVLNWGCEYWVDGDGTIIAS